MIDLSHDRLMALFEISHRINRIGNLRRLLDEILNSAISNIGAERGLLILTDETGESHHTVASQSLENDDITFSRSIVKATLESMQTSLSPDIKSDARFKDIESIEELHILSFICVPLILPGTERPIGTLYVDQREGIKNFSQEDVAFLESLANLAAIAITNTNMMEQIMNENVRLRQEVEKKYEFPGVIGESRAVQDVFLKMKRILDDDCTVLLTGESGTGKEVIAKAIHYNGNRKSKPFLAINCGALAETLLEAELFGSARGAFTGAVDKQGLFQAANCGTLFMDEIHHTSEPMQIKLLRVLQNKEIRRVGGTHSTRVDVRLICATNEDLQNKVQEKRFRQDFFYRINVVTINVPALRKRREDIPLLSAHFLDKYSRQKKKNIQGFTKKATEALMKYDWAENNVRELENEIERAVIFAENDKPIGFKDLSEKIRYFARQPADSVDFMHDEKGKALNLQMFERKYIEYILRQSGGNKAKAAKIMGVPRTTLVSKMKKLGMVQ